MIIFIDHLWQQPAVHSRVRAQPVLNTSILIREQVNIYDLPVNFKVHRIRPVYKLLLQDGAAWSLAMESSPLNAYPILYFSSRSIFQLSASSSFLPVMAWKEKSVGERFPIGWHLPAMQIESSRWWEHSWRATTTFCSRSWAMHMCIAWQQGESFAKGILRSEERKIVFKWNQWRNRTHA